MSQTITIPERVSIQSGPNGLRYIELRCNGAEAHIYLHGAHVLHYQPAGQEPVLWHSRQSFFKDGKAIRGGIPVCWPWFGAHPSDSSKPSHGLARITEWEPVSAHADEKSTTVTLRFPDPDSVQASGELTVVLAESLTVTLTTTNLSPEPMPLTEALHTYFSVGDIKSASVTGLEGVEYIDTLPADQPVLTEGEPIPFAAETDRVYINSAHPCILLDPDKARRILISKKGSQSTVVWNPWIAKAAGMADFGDDEYPDMLCVETANCGPNSLMLAPGQTHSISTCIRTAAL